MRVGCVQRLREYGGFGDAAVDETPELLQRASPLRIERLGAFGLAVR